MKRYFKIFLYGDPSVGKSTFAYGAPKPFFICSDDNYAYLPGAKEENHVVCRNWKQFIKAIQRNFDDYDTIVVDLIEDFYMFCEKDYCVENDIAYVGDHEYGKGWRITKDNFFLEIVKLIALPKNIIFIGHASSYDTKNKRGNTITKYRANYRIKDDVLEQIEGRVQFFLHCYMKEEEEDGQLVNKRYLSLIPKENEYGIARGISEKNAPADIPLEWDAFEEAVNNALFTSSVVNQHSDEPEEIAKPKKDVKPQPKVEETKADKPKVESTPEPKEESKNSKLTELIKQKQAAKAKEQQTDKVDVKSDEVDEEVSDEVDDSDKPTSEAEPKNEVVQPEVIEQKASRASKLDEIRAKLAQKGKNNE